MSDITIENNEFLRQFEVFCDYQSNHDQLIDLPMPSLKATSKEEREQRKQELIETKDEPRIKDLVDQALFFIRDSASRAEPKGQVMFRDHYRESGGKAKDSIINEAHKRAMEIWRND